MKRVLLVTSSYAPAMIADMHRVRHLAWELPKLGWEVEVLAPNVAFQRAACVEPGSTGFFNPDVTCHAAAPDDWWFFRPLKIRSIGWRALQPLRRAGNTVLQQRRFDLIYISTANFPLFCLGPHWTERFGVPYVLDFQDPWVRGRAAYATTRHRIKQRITAALARLQERYAVRHATGIVAVSPAYLEQLRERYPSAVSLGSERSMAVPFAGRIEDIALDISAPTPASTHDIVYVGAGGSIMARAFATICAALAELSKTAPALVASVTIRLHGTHSVWRPGDPRPLQELAARYGLADRVVEAPTWISYRSATMLALQSRGLLVLGVDDTGYVPSKLFNYALTGKPLLACFREDTPPVRLFAQLPGLGHLLTFPREGAARADAGVPVVKAFLEAVDRQEVADRRSLLANYLAPAMARRHADLFNRLCSLRPTR